MESGPVPDENEALAAQAFRDCWEGARRGETGRDRGVGNECRGKKRGATKQKAAAVGYYRASLRKKLDFTEKAQRE